MPNLNVANSSFVNVAIALANNAERSLFVVQYLFILTPPASRPVARIAAALMNAAERGVRIQILLNRFRHGRAASTPPRHRIPELNHPNIDLRFHTAGQVLHTKIIVADWNRLLTGSHNLSHWCLTRSHNLSILSVDKDQIEDLLSIYEPLFNKAERA